MRNIFFAIFLTLSLPLRADLTPKEACRRIQDHLLIANPKSAAVEAFAAYKLFPDSQDVHEMVITSLAACGEIEEMIKEWESFSQKYPNQQLSREVLEEMCFGILKKGQSARGAAPQLINLIAAALTQDMRAVQFLLAGMRHSNAIIRSLAVELGSLYGDNVLKEEIVRLFKEEKIEDVRLAVINAIGTLKIESLYKDLLEIISNSKTKAAEKQAAIQAIVNMRETVDQNELAPLIKSPRSGLRLLGCEMISRCELKQHVELAISLLKDPNSDVQAAALRALGFLKAELNDTVRDLAKNALDPLVGITASWVCLLTGSSEDRECMRAWLFHDDPNVRQLASGAIGVSGNYGLFLAKEGLEKSDDPYVKANLAMALIGQREDCERACQFLDAFLHNNQENWMWNEEGHFRVLKKSTHSHNPAIANYPKVVDQTVRLEILNLLAILEYPQAQASIKEFLKSSRYGVTGLAAETLLGEGDSSALQLVQELLTDKDREVRFEAALVLATWGKDPSAIPTLLDMYPTADRELKIKILEALGRIADKKTVPFLIERLKEPSQVLRMITACILLRTLNN